MSGNKIALDTNIILYLLAGDETVSSFLQDKEAFISVVTELEFIGYPDISATEVARIKAFIGDCTVVNISEEIKGVYANLRKRYRLKLGDAIAAATALSLDIPFMSADNHFKKVEELQLTLYNP